MGTMKVNIQKRGKEKPQQLLLRNCIPAIIYGPKVKNEKVAIDKKTFKEILGKAGETTLFDAELGGKTYNVLIHDIQKDPISMEPIHIDFYAPRLDIEIKARIPLIFEGESPAVKTLGGVLIRSMQEVEVQALPADLPRELKIDLSSLENLDNTLYVKDLKLPKKVKIAIAEDTPIVSVVEPKKEEIAAAAAPEAVTPPPTERETKVAEKVKTETETRTEGGQKTVR